MFFVMEPETPEPPYTPGQVADLYGVSVVTVGVWADEGKLPHFRTPGGQRRFPRVEIDALLAEATTS